MTGIPVKQLKDKDGNDITDANAVHKTGAETIDGVKTFTSTLVGNNAGFRAKRPSNNSGFIQQTTDKDVTVTPSTDSDKYNLISSRDMNDEVVGNIRFEKTTNGKIQLVVDMRNQDGTKKGVVLAESD